jgi:GGDEF domain-containing protein
MQIFDSVDRDSLDRREFQLVMLAMGSILLLGSGFALLAYPMVFSWSKALAGWALKVCFFGFCALCLLLVSYIWQRYRVVCRLREQIHVERRQSAELRRQAAQDLLAALPRFNQFQDRLAMEYRRTLSGSESFSVLVVLLTPAVSIHDQTEMTTAFGDAVKAMGRRLRREDSLYCFCHEAFGTLLPGVTMEQARGLALRLEDALRDAAGAASRFSALVKVFNYPQHAATAHELEQAVRSLLPGDLILEPIVETSDMVALRNER